MLSLILCYWPIALLTSAMIFDAPDGGQSLGKIFLALIISFYPLFIGILLYIFDFPIWGIKPKTLLLVTFFIPFAGIIVMGYPKLIMERFTLVPSFGYYVKDSTVYYSGKKIDASSTTFKVILNDVSNHARNEFARDHKNVYKNGIIVKEADPATFRLIGDGADHQVDQFRVYFQGKALESANPKSFEVLKSSDGSNSRFYRDQSYVFFNGHIIQNINGANAKIISPGYLVDQVNAVYYTTRLEGVDVNTLRVHPKDAAYALDIKFVFYKGTKVQNADPSSFEPLERQYAKDKNHVYYLASGTPRVIHDADAATFMATNYDPKSKSDAKDKYRYYLNGE